MYQASIHPAAPGPSLSDTQIVSLYDALLGVLRTACSCGADAQRFPADWLFHRRWAKKGSSSSSTPRDSAGERISFETVGGRTSAIVLSRQKKGQRKSAAGSVEAKSNKKKGAGQQKTKTSGANKKKEGKAAKTKKRRAIVLTKEDSSPEARNNRNHARRRNARQLGSEESRADQRETRKSARLR